MDWFRMYQEARTDPKLALLSDAQHRVWFNLMCLAGEQPERGMIAGYESFPLALEVSRGDEELLSETVEFLIRARILKRSDDGALTFINWRKRQPEPIAIRVEWDSLRAFLAPLVYERDGWRCRECGASSDLTVDHIEAIARGGDNDLSNLQTLCRSCNSRKGTR